GAGAPGQCATLSPDGKTLVALDKGMLVFWEIDSGKELKCLRSPKPNVGFLRFAPDGKTVAIGRDDWRVSFLEWETGKERDFSFPVQPRPFVEFHMDSSF